jgi:hypothetical protein
MWVTLAIEWPETWRAIARRPELLTRAFGPEKGRKTADEKFIGALAEADRPPALAILRRLRTDRALVALLSRQDDAPAAAGEFAATAMEAEAVFEFNRIIWEPDFRLYADG